MSQQLSNLNSMVFSWCIFFGIYSCNIGVLLNIDRTSTDMRNEEQTYTDALGNIFGDCTDWFRGVGLRDGGWSCENNIDQKSKGRKHLEVQFAVRRSFIGRLDFRIHHVLCPQPPRAPLSSLHPDTLLVRHFRSVSLRGFESLGPQPWTVRLSQTRSQHSEQTETSPQSSTRTEKRRFMYSLFFSMLSMIHWRNRTAYALDTRCVSCGLRTHQRALRDHVVFVQITEV